MNSEHPGTPIATERNTAESPTTQDTPGVIVFPPVLFVSALVSGVLLQLLWPLHLWASWPPRIGGAILAAAGAITAIGAFKSMGRAGTNVRPDMPSTVIVTRGPYRFTRNPIYLANSLVYIGLCLLFNALWPLVTFVPFWLLLHWGVVRREERYLEAKFGETYLAYKARVRRWI